MRHDLKTWPEAFNAILAGSKRHEVRRADRPFAVNDELLLRCFDPTTQRYTDHETLVRVTDLSPPGTWGLPTDLVVMSIAPVAALPAALPVLVADRRELFVNDARILALPPTTQAELLDTAHYQLTRLEQLVPDAENWPHPLLPVVTHALDEMQHGGFAEDHRREALALSPEGLTQKLYGLHKAHIFAIAVHRFTGWPMRCIRTTSGLWCNVVVERPDGLLINVSGAHVPAELLADGYTSAVLDAPISEADLAADITRRPLADLEHEIGLAQFAIERLPWAPFNTSAFVAACRPVA